MTSRSGTAVVLFTRDLRLHDNPTLHRALTDHEQIVPLFVLDEPLLAGAFNRANRAHFLAECLAELDADLQQRGGALVVRRGDVVHEAARVAQEVGASAVHVSGDVSRYAQRRQQRLLERLTRDGVRLHVHDDTIFVVPPGATRPSGNSHWAVFSAYHRSWEKQPMRDPLPAPTRVSMPQVKTTGVPKPGDICPGDVAPALVSGGEAAARTRLTGFLADSQHDYADGHDAMAGDTSSRLSPYLHFGSLSPLEVVRRATEAPEFVRQVAWRDFHAQVLAARPESTVVDYRPRGDRWRDDEAALNAWKQGRTGYPIVDAGMRQLLREGWMHNRARLIVGHFLCKTLYIDWRLGAQHFMDHLLDGDTANNTMNWQWVAGTGTDSRFNRVYSMVLQAKRHDPEGDYVRRYVPELASLAAPAIHEPWTLPAPLRRTLDYPDPIVDNREGNDRFLAARGKR